MRVCRSLKGYIQRKVWQLIEPRLDVYLRDYLLTRVLVFGDRRRVKVASTAVLNNATINVVSGEVIVEDFAFFGHNVALLTGTHDYLQFDRARQVAIPDGGRNITIRRGAWIGSNSTIVGPVTIGDHAVVAAGAVVVSDVAPMTVVAGVPARVVKLIQS